MSTEFCHLFLTTLRDGYFLLPICEQINSGLHDWLTDSPKSPKLIKWKNQDPKSGLLIWIQNFIHNTCWQVNTNLCENDNDYQYNGSQKSERDWGGLGYDKAATTASLVACSEMYVREKASHIDSEGDKMVPWESWEMDAVVLTHPRDTNNVHLEMWKLYTTSISFFLVKTVNQS